MIELISKATFRRLADLAFGASSSGDVRLSLDDQFSATTRFANNEVTQNVAAREQSISVSVSIDGQSGSTSTTDLSDSAVIEAVKRAEEIAKFSPADPEYMPPLPPQEYPILPTARRETVIATPASRIDAAREAISGCKAAGLIGAGIVTTSHEALGIAAKNGLFAYEPRTSAEFSLTASGDDSSGWSFNRNRSFDDLGVRELTRRAIEKARISAKPRELPAGKYTVLLEPAAVAGLLGPLTTALDAKSYKRGTSAIAGKLGQRIIDERLTIKNQPDHPSLLGKSFNGAGLPTDYRTWIERGVLKQLSYDRFTAQQDGVAPTYSPDAIVVKGDAPFRSLDELIRSTELGVLVTNFWYIRSVNPTDLTLTGMTRDGTFLIEKGQIVAGLMNFRWHDSPLRALCAVDAFTPPLDAITIERPKMMLPAMRIRDFNFSSVTRF